MSSFDAGNKGGRVPSFVQYSPPTGGGFGRVTIPEAGMESGQSTPPPPTGGNPGKVTVPEAGMESGCGKPPQSGREVVDNLSNTYSSSKVYFAARAFLKTQTTDMKKVEEEFARAIDQGRLTPAQAEELVKKAGPPGGGIGIFSVPTSGEF